MNLSLYLILILFMDFVARCNCQILFAGGKQTCVIVSTGSLYCWGWNSNGQLGDNSTIDKTTPIVVQGISSIAVHAATALWDLGTDTPHSCAVLSTGAAFCWGGNSYGTLGDSSKTQSLLPVQVEGLLSNALSISAGRTHTCAVIIGGSAKCWGYNNLGRLGDGTQMDRLSPTNVSGLSNVATIHAGGWHSCALLMDGAVKCWGYNNNGQLGDGTTTTRLTPVSVSGLSSHVVALSSSYYHNCAVLNTSNVVCWGANTEGRLGDGTTVNRNTPVSIISDAVAVTTGRWHSCALLSNGSVSCWGRNSEGQVGDGTTTARLSPVGVVNLGDVVMEIAAGHQHTCGLITTGYLSCWGLNDKGQLGIGSNVMQLSPVSIADFVVFPMPTSQPSSQPSLFPSSLPTNQPTSQPSESPSSQPSNNPTSQPSSQPTCAPSNPSSSPTLSPTTSSPSVCPSLQPSSIPSSQPTISPTCQPTIQPSSFPSTVPTVSPSSFPTAQPTLQPSSDPTTFPSAQPSSQPFSVPSQIPTDQPSMQPTTIPTSQPSLQPQSAPSQIPTDQPSMQPTTIPTSQPSLQPQSAPSQIPTDQPSMQPTTIPSSQPNGQPSANPSGKPSGNPFAMPSSRPTAQPTFYPSAQPSQQPLSLPSSQPSSHPTFFPLGAQPGYSELVSLSPDTYSTFDVQDTRLTQIFNYLLAQGSNKSYLSFNSSISKLTIIVLNVSRQSLSNTSLVFVPHIGSASVALSLSSLAPLVLSIGELSSTAFLLNSSHVSAGSNETTTSVSPKLLSNIVTLQLGQLTGNGSVVGSPVGYFETRMTISDELIDSSLGFGQKLSHNCSIGNPETISMVCIQTNLRLNLTCSGKRTTVVNHQCPIPRTVCSALNMADSTIVSNDYCQAEEQGSIVVCKCGLQGQPTNGNGSVSTIGLDGKVSIGVFRTYSASSLTSSVMVSVSSLSASTVASNSILILVSFGCVWGLGLLSMYMFWSQTKDKSSKHLLKVHDGNASPMEPSWLSLLPCYFQAKNIVELTGKNHSFLAPWMLVLVQRHTYLRIAVNCLFRSKRGEIPNSSRWMWKEMMFVEESKFLLDIVKVLTAITTTCFILALLYDYQYPEDDGFCSAQTVKEVCLSRKMLLDPWRSQCLWIASTGQRLSRDGEDVIEESLYGRLIQTIPVMASENSEDTLSTSCRFDGSSNSSVAFVFSFLISSLFANAFHAVLNLCVGVFAAKSLVDKRRYEEAVQPVGDQQGQEDNNIASRLSRVWWCLGQGSSLPEELAEREGGVSWPWMPITKTMSNMKVLMDHKTAENGFDRFVSVVPLIGDSKEDKVEKQNASMLPACMVTLVRLSIADALLSGSSDVTGHDRYQRQVFVMSLYRSFHRLEYFQHPARWQTLASGLLFAFNVGSMYFLFTKAAVRGYQWQVSLLEIAVFEWLTEVLFMQPLEILVLDCWLPSLIYQPVMLSVQGLRTSWMDFCMRKEGRFTLGRKNELLNGNVLLREDGQANKGSTSPESKQLVSLQLASHYPSHWLSETVLKMLSLYKCSECLIPAGKKVRWYSRLLVSQSMDVWENVLSLCSALLLGWIIFVYYVYFAPWLLSLSHAEYVTVVTLLVVLSLGLAGLGYGVYRHYVYRPPSVDIPPMIVPTEHPVEHVDVDMDGDIDQFSTTSGWCLSENSISSSEQSTHRESALHATSKRDNEEGEEEWEGGVHVHLALTGAESSKEAYDSDVETYSFSSVE